MEKSPPPPYEAEASERTSLLSSHLPPSYTSSENPKTIRTSVNAQNSRDEESFVIISQPAGRFRRGRLIATLLIVAFSVSVWYLTKSFGDGNGDKVVKEVRIAVVGAGPAGISTAYSLSQLSNLPIPVKVTVFEQKDRIGGRLVLSASSTAPLLVKVHAEDLATGVLLAGNSILSQRAEKILGTKKVTEGSGEVIQVGFWDGERMRSVQTKPVGKSSWAEWFADVKRYGVMVLWNARRLSVGTMKGWRELLSSKDKRNTLAEMGAMQLSAEERLKKNGVTGSYVTEIVESVLQRHFRQSVDEVSDLTLSMALEREFSPPSPSSANGRFETILQYFFDKSGAELHLDTKITSLQKSSREEDGQVEWILTTLSNTQKQTSQHIFDKIILAAPWNTSSLLNSTQNEKVEQVSYRPLHQTLITSNSKINASYFNAKEDDLPEQILPISSSSPASLSPAMAGIHSISFVRRIFTPDLLDSNNIATEAVRYLYSIGSSRPLSLATIETLWGKGEVEAWVTEEIVDAFPLLYPRSFEAEGVDVDVGGQGVWHAGAWEGIASSVDWSWVVGEMVAERVGEELRAGRV